jgi:hypothetical protein
MRCHARHAIRCFLGLTIFAVACMARLIGCWTFPQPWEKAVQAKPEMAIEGDDLEGRFRGQTDASKEATAGGGGVSGVGCGCN